MKSLVRAEVTKCLDFVQILALQQEASTCGAVFGRTVCEVIPKGTGKVMLLQACDCRTCWLSFSKHGILRIIAIKCLKGPGSSSAKAHTSQGAGNRSIALCMHRAPAARTQFRILQCTPGHRAAKVSASGVPSGLCVSAAWQKQTGCGSWGSGADDFCSSLPTLTHQGLG